MIQRIFQFFVSIGHPNKGVNEEINGNDEGFTVPGRRQ